MYMPVLARFTARDPLSSVERSVLIGSAYGYGINSPTLRFDPSGLQPEFDPPPLGLPDVINKLYGKLQDIAASAATVTGGGLIALHSVQTAQSADNCCDGVIKGTAASAAAAFGLNVATYTNRETLNTAELAGAGWTTIKWSSKTLLFYNIICCIPSATPTGEVRMSFYLFEQLNATDPAGKKHFVSKKMFHSVRTIHPGYNTPPDLTFSAPKCCKPACPVDPLPADQYLIDGLAPAGAAAGP